MIDTLKKTLYAGLGATVVTAEKIEAALGDLVKKGKLSAEEARETARKISDESKREFEEARHSLQSLFDDLLDRAPVVRKKDLEAINRRLAAIEEQLKKPEASDS